jgi:hypothetical protein
MNFSKNRNILQRPILGSKKIPRFGAKALRLRRLRIRCLNCIILAVRTQGQFAIGYHHAGDIVDEVLADELNRRIAPIGFKVLDDRFDDRFPKMRCNLPRSFELIVFSIDEMFTKRQKNKSTSKSFLANANMSMRSP